MDFGKEVPDVEQLLRSILRLVSQSPESDCQILIEGDGNIRVGEGPAKIWHGTNGLWVPVDTEVTFEGLFVIEISCASRGISFFARARTESLRLTTLSVHADALTAGGWDVVKVRSRTSANIVDCYEVYGLDACQLSARGCHLVRACNNCRFDLVACAVVDIWRPANGKTRGCRFVQHHGRPNPPSARD